MPTAYQFRNALKIITDCADNWELEDLSDEESQAKEELMYAMSRLLQIEGFQVEDTLCNFGDREEVGVKLGELPPLLYAGTNTGRSTFGNKSNVPKTEFHTYGNN